MINNWSVLKTKEEFPVSNNKLYLAFSGHLKTRGLIGVGTLEGKDKLTQDIKALRMAHNYRSQIKYKSSDRYKVTFSKELIDLFMDADVRLFVKLVDNPYNQLVNKSPLYKIDYRIGLYAELIQAMDINSSNPTIYVKSESAFGPSRSFRDKVEADEGIKFKLRAVKSHDDDVLQLTGFLIGNIVADIRGEVNNVHKVDILNYLKSKLGIQSFQGQSNIQNKIMII